MAKKDATKTREPKQTAGQTAVTKPAKPDSHVPVKPKGCFELLNLLAAQDHFADPADLADALLVFKSLVALLLGIGMGLARVTGGVGIQTFLGAAIGGSILMVRNWLKKEDEEVGGVQKIAIDGLMPSLSIFILVWGGINTVLVWK